MEPTGPYNVASNIVETDSGVAVDVVANDSLPFLLATSQGFAEPAASTEIRVDRLDAISGRLFDLLVATAILILVLPLMILCASAVLLSGPGPLLYRQSRIGRGGAQFTCLKFRTMTKDADSAIAEILRQSAQSVEQWQAVQKLQCDPRVTLIGQFLRRYSLDELPQLFNVLAGQMSVVGPRPIVADEIVRYGLSFPGYCSVKPGLTGLWQVSGRHSLPYSSRVQLDAEYARLKSVRLDLIILLRTVPIVFLGENM